MMRGHTGKTVEDVDRIGVVYHLHAFAHILYRHAVVVLVQRDVTVALGLWQPSAVSSDTCPGQRPQTVSLDRIEQLTAGFLRRVRLRALNFSVDLRIATLSDSRSRNNTPSRSTYTDRYISLIFVFSTSALSLGCRTRAGDYGASVMLGKGFEVRIDYRLVCGRCA